MVTYRDLTDLEAVTLVPSSVRSLADDVVAKTTADLGLNRTVKLTWFIEAPAGFGYTRPFRMKGETGGLSGIVRIDAGLSASDLINTIAHELRHVWQFQNQSLSPLAARNAQLDLAVSEADARSYAARLTARFLGRNATESDESPEVLLRELRKVMAL